MKNILIISHKEKECGVHQYGENVAKALQKSTKYSFIYLECSSLDEFFIKIINNRDVSAIVYNHHPATLPWLNEKIIKAIDIPHIGIVHEVTQSLADSITNNFFDYYIAPDPTLKVNNPIIFKTGRIITPYVNKYDLPKIPIIGSFGFGLQGKGFEKIITTVQQEYDEALIKLHIPFATFGDSDGSKAISIAQLCKKLIVKPGIQLSLSHNFMTEEKLLDFLAQNTLNAFFYEKYEGRGISSVIDYALAVKRPIAITQSNMFRHIISSSPSICIDDSSLKQIIDNGVAPLIPFYDEWSEANFILDYERIIDQVLSQYHKNKTQSLQIQQSSSASVDDSISIVGISNVTSFNRILDNAARLQYKSVIDQLFMLLPDMMARKIPEANIQQAFVLDTVQKFASRLSSPKILCVGSYEDTAASGLKNLGYQMEEIDPALNYDLNTFFHKSSTVKGSYDIIFSTSVLEHVQDDELFMTQIAKLLAPGGTAVLTCDYNDHYKPGDKIPVVDFRLYTQKDFKQRLLPLLEDCFLVDVPQWDCPNPDFTYEGCRYTFATFVFQKKVVSNGNYQQKIDQTLLLNNLREINLIICPDWFISEDLLLSELERVINALITHPNPSSLTLFIEASNILEDDADLIISAVIMNVLMSKNLDPKALPEISLIDSMAVENWDSFLSHLNAHIILNYENHEIVTQLKLDCLSAVDINNIHNIQYQS